MSGARYSGDLSELPEARRYKVRINVPAAARRRGSVLGFFAGQVDPGDESRFVIPYSFDGADGTLEGTLRGDGPHLRVIDGPLTPPK